MVDDCADVGKERRKRKRRERREVNKTRLRASGGGRSGEDVAGSKCGSREKEKNRNRKWN